MKILKLNLKNENEKFYKQINKIKTILTQYLPYTYHIIVSVKMSTSKMASKFLSGNGIKFPGNRVKFGK